jgi:phage-related protein
MKRIIWNPKARDFVRGLSEATRSEVGTLLLILQQGAQLREPQSKPMRSIHPKAFELKITDRRGSYRIIYVLHMTELILIPHAFTKKTQKTPSHEIQVASIRLRELLNET